MLVGATMIHVCVIRNLLYAGFSLFQRGESMLSIEKCNLIETNNFLFRLSVSFNTEFCVMNVNIDQRTF